MAFRRFHALLAGALFAISAALSAPSCAQQFVVFKAKPPFDMGKIMPDSVSNDYYVKIGTSDGVQIGTTLQMKGIRGERGRTRSPEGTQNPEKARGKAKEIDSGKTKKKSPTQEKKPEAEKPRSGKKEQARLEREKARKSQTGEKE